MKKIIFCCMVLISYYNYSQNDFINDIELNNLKTRVKIMSSDSLDQNALKILRLSDNFSEDDIVNLSEVKKGIIYSDIMLTENINRGYKIEKSYFLRGIARYKIRSYIFALRDFVSYSELRPDKFQVYEWISRCKIKLNDNFGAISDIDVAIKLLMNNNPDTEILSRLYQTRAICNFDLKKYEDGYMDINRSIALNNKNGMSYAIRGDYLYNFIDKEKACIDWSKAGELGVENAYNKILKNCN